MTIENNKNIKSEKLTGWSYFLDRIYLILFSLVAAGISWATFYYFGAVVLNYMTVLFIFSIVIHPVYVRYGIIRAILWSVFLAISAFVAEYFKVDAGMMLLSSVLLLSFLYGFIVKRFNFRSVL